MANRPQFMGIVNVTPDSFSDGGKFDDVDAAIEHGLRLAREGADILDIGGESTRPGADTVSVEEELARVMPVVEGLVKASGAEISIDTRKADIAKKAVAAGAAIWNDVSALTYDAQSVEVAKELGCEIVLMHAQGAPQTMQHDPHYTDVVAEVLAYLAARVELCVAAGIPREKLIADPGIGFGKTLEHNLALLSHLERFQALECRVLLGASRKRFIAALDEDGPADERIGGSIAVALDAAGRGADILRVHDVAATRQALNVARAIKKTS